MYNRYVPQPDGSYRRNRMQDTRPPEATPAQPPPCAVPPAAQPLCTEAPPKTEHHSYRQKSHPEGGFLRQLLPKDFDTGDLIVILLLLLMAGDCEEEKNNALLTLALYFFL